MKKHKTTIIQSQTSPNGFYAICACGARIPPESVIGYDRQTNGILAGAIGGKPPDIPIIGSPLFYDKHMAVEAAERHEIMQVPIDDL